jgi:copper chaperone NosL
MNSLRFVVCIFLAAAMTGCGDKKGTAVPAAKKLSQDGTFHVSEEDRCPVCAMAVSKHPKTAAAMTLTDGTTYYFCGTGCLIKSWLHPEVYLGVDKSRAARAVVHGYFDGKPIDALKARWVAGSDVVGPMGPALVPLANDEDLAKFKERHGGKAEFSLQNLDDARFESVTGKQVLPGKK